MVVKHGYQVEVDRAWLEVSQTLHRASCPKCGFSWQAPMLLWVLTQAQQHEAQGMGCKVRVEQC